ncbi:type II toxin-antitoxin system VapC family toxin [Candidatus Protofrankia californiensis]|uniref:type II toxin-antitoxin system VapC family toxin n=1 Tax=Candidatus Protofrankia californiensis TaxID=1839754 RepID=UPI0010416461|nr:type II toxin-antitoxin system VapC family toxin [Candidatus Protofrankia californiensis]
MKLPDVNLLIYALDNTSPRHEPSRAWLEHVLSGTETVAFTWPVLLGVIRLTTRATIFRNPFRPDEILDIVDGWLTRPCAVVVHPTERHAAVLHQLLEPLGTAGNLTSDAHLAALAIEHGAELCSSDADFARFPGVRWVDPLKS